MGQNCCRVVHATNRAGGSSTHVFDGSPDIRERLHYVSIAVLGDEFPALGGASYAIRAGVENTLIQINGGVILSLSTMTRRGLPKLSDQYKPAASDFRAGCA
jgi:hypothetical protein